MTCYETLFIKWVDLLLRVVLQYVGNPGKSYVDHAYVYVYDAYFGFIDL